MINTHWGGLVENNHFGTHEFMDLCEQLDCEPYICGNVGSGTVQEMAQWVEYLTFEGESPMGKPAQRQRSQRTLAVEYFGVGNENWGCGGRMRPNITRICTAAMGCMRATSGPTSCTASPAARVMTITIGPK